MNEASINLASTRTCMALAVATALLTLGAGSAMASPGCPGALSDTTYTVSDAETYPCYLNHENNLVVTDTGSLVTSDPAAVNVRHLAGSVNNRGTITGDGFGILVNNGYGEDSTLNGGITNSGAITSSFSGIAVGSGYGEDGSGNSTINGGITNNGAITGSFSGILVGSWYGEDSNSHNTINGGITNSGTITGGAFGIAVASLDAGNAAINGGISNSGTINGDEVAGILLLNATINGSIANSGTILGGQVGIFDYYAGNSAITGGITNSGTIQGDLASIYWNSSVPLDINITGNNTAHFVGDVIAPNTSVAVKSGATFSNDNAFNVKSFAIEDGATFNFGTGPQTYAGEQLGEDSSQVFQDGITVSNGFSNAGKVAIAEGITATIHGDYTQTATGALQIGASSASSYGKLVVDGTANIAGKAVVDAKQVNTLANHQILSSVVSAGTLSGNFASVDDNSAMFNFKSVVNGNAIDLTVVNALTAFEAASSTGNNPAYGAARVLDSIVEHGASGDMQNIITAMGKLESKQDVSNAVSQTLPLLNGGQTAAVQSALQGTNRVVQARQNSNRGMSSGDMFAGNKKLWAKAFGSRADQNDRNGVSGFDADTYGLVIGTDSEISSSNRLGAAFAYSRSDIDGNSSVARNNAKVDSYQALIYGSHSLGERTEFNFQGDLGFHKTDGSRIINFGGLNRVAQSDYDSYSAHLGAGIGRSYAVSEKTTLIPNFSFNYTWIKDKSYSETGADALNLNVDERNNDQLIFAVGGKLTHQVSESTMLLANLGAGYDALARESSITAAYVGGGAAFVTNGLNPSPALVNAGLGLVTKTASGMEFVVRYDIEARHDFKNQTASAKLRWTF